jgi:hypothetical protein
LRHRLSTTKHPFPDVSPETEHIPVSAAATGFIGNLATGGRAVHTTDHRQKALWALAAFVLLLSGVARGQIITSTILGNVSDSSGAVVPGAEVDIVNQGTSIVSKTVTDSAGLYSVSGLPAGVYTVKVVQSGFETSEVTDLQLLSARTQRVDVKLKVGTARQVVTVTGEKVSMVHTDSISVGTLFNSQQLAELPLYNDTIDSLDKLVPGYMFAQSVNNPRINGGTYLGSTNFTLNGAQANDLANGGAAYDYSAGELNYPQPESFQEYPVD